MNTKTKRILLISLSVILLCLAIIVGSTFALFTDSVIMKNHLKAGNLDVALTRTNLKYSVLNDLGELDELELGDDHDFTSATTENIFGLGAENVKVVPGSYFEAELMLSNRGNVAFNYSVHIELESEANILAEQLTLTLTRADGTVETKKVSELATGLSVGAGKMTLTDTAQTFTIRVDFVNLPGKENNPAKNLDVVFDIIVTATQATAD